MLPLRSALLGAALLVFVSTQETDPCANAPNAAAKIMCRQIHKWDDSARTAAAKKKKVTLPPGFEKMIGGSVAAELAPIASTIYQCMDMGCVCNYLRGVSGPVASGITNGAATCTLPSGQVLRKAVRKEYRMMTDDERNRFHNALNTLKQSGEYNRLARVHSEATNSGGAHSGPAFLPWHREFTKRMELAIRQIDPTLFLPYWDSAMDSNLPVPRDSIMWTPEFLGSTSSAGIIADGPFFGWRTFDNRAGIARAVGKDSGPFKESEISFALSQNNFQNIMAFTAPRPGCPFVADYNVLEYTHGNAHIFTGGDMLDTATSANDPAFFLHHSFVDLVWEMWRQTKQARAARETTYPADNVLCSGPQHFAAASLLPFTPMRNIDGLSNKFTDNMYEYAPRPTCNAQTRSCGSQYLFCDVSHGAPRCAPKVRIGGSCQGFVSGEAVCHNGQCQGGRCVANPNQPPATARPPVTPRPTVPAPRQEVCFNENACCASWAVKGECQRNAEYMGEWCKASCGQCKPTSYTLKDDCSDRHSNCRKWSAAGECTRNQMWMAENCRQSCNKCSRTRAQECGGGGGGTTVTTPRPAAQCQNSEGCFNENACCAHWALMGQCSRNSTWMACNCRVSCGHCSPDNYNFGACDDYHSSCNAWAQRGECEKNPWMAENCRLSCGSCFSQQDLRQQCNAGVGMVAPMGKRQANVQRQRWAQRGGQAGGDPWGAGGWDGWQQGGGWGGQGWGGGNQWQQQGWNGGGRGGFNSPRWGGGGGGWGMGGGGGGWGGPGGWGGWGM